MGSEEGQETQGQTEPAFAAETAKRTRARSQIEFPYNDLESGIELASMLHQKAGMACEDVQLASWLNQSAVGGGFRSRLSAGRMFGLIETNGAMVTITSLGLDAIDGDRGPAARAEAFLRVELFRAMYEQFKGYALPPAAALERQMEALGVAPKQKDRARQTFMKSAHYAGYIDSQTGRFTKPAFVAPASSQLDKAQSAPVGGGSGGGEPPTITEKALEYRLVDLMAEAMDDAEVLQAIIRVITFLKARDAKKTATDK